LPRTTWNRIASAAGWLTGVGFALGSTVHAVSGVLLWWGFEIYGPGYPSWRHAAFALIDAAIACVAWQWPKWLVFPLAAFALDQLIEHGVTPVFVLVMIAVAFAIHGRWGTPAT
jgi:hypothetical protein